MYLKLIVNPQNWSKRLWYENLTLKHWNLNENSLTRPEYAFGIPGTSKNALDWTVSSGEFVNKPTAVIVASTGGENAFHSLLLTLKAISANIGDKSTLLVSFIRSKLNKTEVTDAELKISLREVVGYLIKSIQNKQE